MEEVGALVEVMKKEVSAMARAMAYLERELKAEEAEEAETGSGECERRPAQ